VIWILFFLKSGEFEPFFGARNPLDRLKSHFSGQNLAKIRP